MTPWQRERIQMAANERCEDIMRRLPAPDSGSSTSKKAARASSITAGSLRARVLTSARKLRIHSSFRIFGELFRLGHVHTVESWREGRLVGGLYGLQLGAAFFGESMFSVETDASKVAFIHLVARLRRGGFRLLDTQFVTDHLARFGVVEVPRSEYHTMLEAALAEQAEFRSYDQDWSEPGPVPVSGNDVLQSISQTS